MVSLFIAFDRQDALDVKGTKKYNARIRVGLALIV